MPRGVASACSRMLRANKNDYAQGSRRRGEQKSRHKTAPAVHFYEFHTEMRAVPAECGSVRVWSLVACKSRDRYMAPPAAPTPGNNLQLTLKKLQFLYFIGTKAFRLVRANF